jgi:hypothetical protein
MLSKIYDCLIIDRVISEIMGNKRVRNTLIILASVSCLVGCKKPPEEMTTEEVYEEYYQSICIELGHKVWSKKMKECIAEQIHESHKLGE